MTECGTPDITAASAELAELACRCGPGDWIASGALAAVLIGLAAGLAAGVWILCVTED